MNETTQKHLELIQGVVNRLSTNSFLLKGWTVALISALFVLGAANSNKIFIWLAYFPGIVFWLLDGYYLCLERRFRLLYDEVRTSEGDSSFDMSTDAYATKETVMGATARPAVVGFHLPLLVIILIVAVSS